MEGSGLENVFETEYGKNTVNHMFSQKTTFRSVCCYFLFETTLQMTLIKYLLPEKALGIDENATEETADQNFSIEEFLTTNVAHTPTTPLFCYCLAFWVFLTDLMTPSVGAKHNGNKPTSSGNLKPSVILGENLRSIGRQMCPQAQVLSVKRQEFIHWQRLATLCIPQHSSTIIL